VHGSALPKDHLRAAKKGERPSVRVFHHRVPNVRPATFVFEPCFAREVSFTHGAEKVAFELYRRKSLRTLREVRDRSASAGSVGKRDDARAVQIAVRREQLFADLELCFDASVGNAGDFHSD
jgi:hypothetical protein